MAEHRVSRTAKETAWTGGEHRHIAALCLSDGGRVEKAEAIRRINLRLDSYYTLEAGQRAEVEVVSRCSQCGTEYLRTDRDPTTKNNLLSLPDC